jgi:hypothetical protein
MRLNISTVGASRNVIAVTIIGAITLLLAQDVLTAGNVATLWLNQAFDAVRAGIPAINTGTPGAARMYAMVNVAMYDAVNGIDRARNTSNLKQWLVSASGAPAEGSPEHAAAAAAHAVLVALFPDRESTLNAALIPDCPLPIADTSEAGCRWGHQVGAAVVNARANDGTQVNQTQPGGTGAGVFPRTFSGTQFKDMVPFGVQSIEPYLSDGPPDLASEEYAENFNEVKELGSANDTDTERAAIARHWRAEGGTIRETGLWLKAAVNVAEDQATVSSLSATVRLFALLGMAIADAVKASWIDKFESRHWRPGDAIRQAEIDGNDATVPDPSWNPRDVTCAPGTPLSDCAFGGTPEYTSGTSTFAGAASTVLEGFYCHDDVSFQFAGEPPTAMPPPPLRSYTRFKEAAREAGRSRVYGGIHFQYSIEAGYEAGKGIGREILRTRLVPDDQACHGATCVCVPR